MTDDLKELARLYGVDTSYHDALGQYVEAGPESLLAVLRALGAPVESVDDAPAALEERRRELAGRGIYLYYLPAYSPELNRIEPVFKQVKHHEIPRRSHTSKAELRESVERGFDSYGKRLRPKSAEQLRPAA